MAKTRPAIGAVRFVCFVTPTDKVKAAATALGWTEDCANGLLDYVDADADYTIGRAFPTLEKAITYGADYVRSGNELWNLARIEKQTFDYDQMEGCEDCPPEWQQSDSDDDYYNVSASGVES